MPEAARKPLPDTYFDDPISGIVRRVPPAPAVEAPLVAPYTAEPVVRPRLWVSTVCVLLVVSLSVGAVALAAGRYELAASCAGVAAPCIVLLGLTDSWGLSS